MHANTREGGWASILTCSVGAVLRCGRVVASDGVRGMACEWQVATEEEGEEEADVVRWTSTAADEHETEEQTPSICKKVARLVSSDGADRKSVV